jgi:hypothetical protein
MTTCTGGAGRLRNTMPSARGFHSPKSIRKTAYCHACSKAYRPNSGYQKFCSSECIPKPNYETNSQYRSISGNWRRYYCRALQGQNRKELSVDFLMDLHEKQRGLCDLSGVEMTCLLEKGKRFWTNASIDRIVAGGPYSRENVRLTCVAVNVMRSQMATEDFISMCKEIANGKGT